MKNSFFQILITMLLLAGCALHHASAPVPTASSHNPYSSPLSTPGARFGALPQVVQNTVRTEAGTAEIVDVRKETSGDRPFYKISFRDAGNFPPMYIGVDGSVLNPDLSVAVPAPLEASLEICPQRVASQCGAVAVAEGGLPYLFGSLSAAYFIVAASIQRRPVA